MIVHLAGPVRGAAVAQVSSLVQIHGQDLVARIQNGSIDGVVRRGAGIGLHIDMLGPVKLLGPVTSQGFHLVGKFAAGLIPPAGVSLQGFVRKHATVQFQDLQGNGALGGNHFDVVNLAIQIALDHAVQLGIGNTGVLQHR